MTRTSGPTPDQEAPPCVHFVGFRGDEYWSAVRVWGRPDFIHQRWDLRARRDIGEQDTVVFATGDENQEVSRWNGNDIDERWLPGGEFFAGRSARAGPPS